VAAAYAEVGRRQENAHGELPKIELNELDECGVGHDGCEKDQRSG